MKFELEDNIWWTTNQILPSWKGFQIRDGDYGAQNSILPSDGHVKIVFAPEGRGNKPLIDSELASVAWIIKNEAAISKALLNSLLGLYPDLQKHYGFSDDEKTKYMPEVTCVDDFRKLIGIHTLYVHPIQKDGVPYAGLEFGCTWDEEHGLGALMHGTRVVEISGADTAFLLWLAERDAERSI